MIAGPEYGQKVLKALNLGSRNNGYVVICLVNCIIDFHLIHYQARSPLGKLLFRGIVHVSRKERLIFQSYVFPSIFDVFVFHVYLVPFLSVSEILNQ